MLTMLHVEEPAGGATTPPLPFSSFSPSGVNPASTELSLIPTPEPGSAALLGLGFSALLGAVRPRRHKVLFSNKVAMFARDAESV